MNRFFNMTVLLLALSAGISCAAAPATAPAPAPAAAAPSGRPAANYASPLDTLRTYLYARYYKDVPSVRDTLNIAPGQEANVKVALDAMAASDGLQTAATAKFGADGAKQFDRDAEKKFKERLAALEKWDIAIRDNSATATAPKDDAAAADNAGGKMLLVKTSAGWKIDGITLYNPNGDAAADVARRIDLLKTSIDVCKSVAADIGAGKYPAASDAYRDYWLRMAAATRAATQPATAPATSTAPVTAP